MKTCRKCGLTFKQIQKINGKQHNLSKRVYCLSCSPFGQRNNRILEVYNSKFKICPRCELQLPISSFYVSQPSGKINSYCSLCASAESAERKRKLKMSCVAYLGGSCIRCGYNKCLGALEFHHRDPSKKDFGIANFRGSKLTNTITNELDKCDLLCSNCHREEHWNKLRVAGIAPTFTGI